MKKLSLIVLILLSSLLQAQDSKQEKKKGFKLDKLKTFNLGESVGKVTGNLLTGKSDELDGIIAKANYVNGVYSFDIKTTESKFFPDYTQEGDHIAAITFFKSDGIGLVKIQGEITADGVPMEYLGMGSFSRHYTEKPTKPVQIDIKTEAGDEAQFILKPIPEVEIISVNDETVLPILDLDEDIKLTYYNPPGSEGTTVKVSLLTKVMGVTALNHFAEFKVKETGNTTVTIPKEALRNPEYSDELNLMNFNKGDNYLIVEREVKTMKEDFGEEQLTGDLQASELFTRNYASFPVIIKGKQDGGMVTVLKVRGKSEDETTGYDFFKPNANSGIPFSRASKFGLVALTIQAKTFKRETDVSTKSWTVGNTKYTQTTHTTTTYQFPELPEEHWQYCLEQIYADIESFFLENYNIQFAPVDKVTSTPSYPQLFPTSNTNNYKEANHSYKNTLRYNPQSIGEIISMNNANFTTDNPTVNIMKEAEDLDGLVAISIELQVAANSKGNIVLIPKMSIMIHGRDETKDDKQGTYFEGVVTRTTGETYNENLLRANKNELMRVCSIAPMIEATKDAIDKIIAKETELGFDKIWSIGE